MNKRILTTPTHYVISRDTFMSGWGKAKNKDNWVYCECYGESEAEMVKSYAKDRGDQEQVYISQHFPKKLESDSRVVLSEVNGWVETAKRKGY